MKKSYVTIIAQITAKEEDRESVKSELVKVGQGSRAEEGNIDYVLHSDNDNPNQFFVYERWASLEAIKAHGQSEHFLQFKKATEGKLEEFKVNKMTEIVK